MVGKEYFSRFNEQELLNWFPLQHEYRDTSQGFFTFVSGLRTKDTSSVFGFSISSLCSPWCEVFCIKTLTFVAHVEDCSVAYWVGRMGRVVLLGVHPTETSVLCLPLERKFGREVQENCSRRVWTRWPNSSLPSHPSSCIEAGLWRTRHGASFICTRRCLHFRPSSGAVERACKGAECSLITNHMLWILNGRVQNPGG